MTDMPHHDDEPRWQRLAVLETGLRHFQEIFEIRNEQMKTDLGQLHEQNRRQDRDRELMEEKLLSRIAEIYALIWAVVKWLSGFLTVTLCSIILKTLHLI